MAEKKKNGKINAVYDIDWLPGGKEKGNKKGTATKTGGKIVLSDVAQTR